jgi:hypothetical protein
MTDDAKKQREQREDHFTERGGWQKQVKPPTADAKPPGPAPKTVSLVAPAPAPAADKKGNSDG